VGNKVVVFEQHSTVGGSTHCFKHDGFDFDVGVHYIGNMLDCRWSPFRILFDYLSDGQLEWARIDDTFDVAYNNATGVRLEFTGNAKANRQMLLKAFPHVDPKALDKYYQKCRYARLVASISFLLKCLPPFMTRIVWSLGYQYLFRKVCLGVTLDVMRNDCGLPDDVIGGRWM
jgi:all-trans-retinol 13,14-reductase